MKSLNIFVAASALAFSLGANASVSGSTFTPATGSSFLTLSSAGLTGVASLSGGAVYSVSSPTVAAMPMGTVGNFLAAGSTGAATLDFGSGVSFISFLWGSPDLYNVLTVTTTDGISQTFTAPTLGFTVMNGNQSVADYVEFSASSGSKITSITFDNLASQNAFEVANFSVTSPVPEPETFALLLAGLGAIGFVARQKSR